jgi:hypothetical protein
VVRSSAASDVYKRQDMSGAYIVKDNGDETEVTFELTVALSMPVPEMMRTKAEKATIDLTLKQLKEKLEN